MCASAKLFVPTFEKFAAISGLALNLGKTVFIPLGDDTLDSFRQDLELRFPGWGAAGVRWWADYLGFTLGPESQGRSWRKAMLQYTRRTDLWAQLGLGLHYTSVAYNVYIASLLGFLLQLEVLPDAWVSVEAAALRRLVPGPAKWILPADLHASGRTTGSRRSSRICRRSPSRPGSGSPSGKPPPLVGLRWLPMSGDWTP